MLPDALGRRSAAAYAAPTVHHIVLVEDDPAIAQPLQRALVREGFDVTHADRGLAAIEAVKRGGVDLVLLDLTLPDLDGLDVCRRIRASNLSIPIIMLTARSEEVDLVVGFDAGADDYLTKPFSMGELAARVRARLRVAAPPVAVEAQAIRLDLEAHRAFNGTSELQLTPKEFELLALLVSEAGRVVTRQRIIAEVWDESWFGNTRALDVHISALRRKLDDPPEHPRFIRTIRGVGFRFEAGGE